MSFSNKNDQWFLESVARQARDAILVTRVAPIDEPDGPTIVYCNPGFERMTGWRREEILGKTPRILQVDERDRAERNRIREAMMRWNAGEDDVGLTCELLNKTKSGERFWVELQLMPLWGETRETSYWGSIQRDVTERRRVEAEMAHHRRMDALGQMAAGAAHDFNNLLGVLLSHAELLDDTDGLDPSARESVAEIRRAISRGESLTRGLLGYARKGAQEREEMDLGALIEALIPFLKRILPANIRLDLAGVASGHRTFLNRDETENAIINLILNARDAMPHGGRLRVAVDSGPFREPQPSQSDMSSNDHVRLTIEDDGDGMSDDVRERIFEPFFTTKGAGGGNGLGLSAVFGFVKQSGGFIDVDSAPGRGSVFRLYFPRAISSADLPRAGAEGDSAAATRRFALNALVLEDDLQLRKALRKLLERDGVRVHEAGDVEAAETVLARNTDVTLLVSDILLPGRMRGDDFTRRVLRENSQMTAILVTGYDGHVGDAAGDKDLSGRIVRLSKPYRARDLRAALAKLSKARADAV